MKTFLDREDLHTGTHWKGTKEENGRGGEWKYLRNFPLILYAYLFFMHSLNAVGLEHFFPFFLV